MINRRTFLLSGAAAAALLVTGVGASRLRGTAAEAAFEIQKTDAEWKAALNEASYRVLRHEDTEPPFSSPLLKEKRAGIYHCAGCELPVYSSDAKFDSGTGWPSFWESLPDAVATKSDYFLVVRRTEVHCRRCGGHFGHIFDDGPPPTGKRHCLNGLALTFVPA